MPTANFQTFSNIQVVRLDVVLVFAIILGSIAILTLLGKKE